MTRTSSVISSNILAHHPCPCREPAKRASLTSFSCLSRLGEQGQSTLHHSLSSLSDNSRALQSLSHSGTGGAHSLLAQTAGGYASAAGLGLGMGLAGGGSHLGARDTLSVATLAGLTGVRGTGQLLSPLSPVSGILGARASSQIVFPSQQSASATLAQQQAVHQQQDLAGKKALQENDALNFLSDVNARFQQRPSVYTEFLNIMRGFKVQEMDAQTGTASTFVKVKQVT